MGGFFALATCPSSSSSASVAHLPRPSLRMPGCPTLCPLGQRRVTSALHHHCCRKQTLDACGYVYRESALNSDIPQAGIVVAPIHVLESSAFENVSDSRRQTTSRLASAPNQVWRGHRPYHGQPPPTSRACRPALLCLGGLLRPLGMWPPAGRTVLSLPALAARSWRSPATLCPILPVLQGRLQVVLEMRSSKSMK